MQDEGVYSLYDTNISKSVDNVNTFVKKYFKVVKDCESKYSGCFSPQYKCLRKDCPIYNVPASASCNGTFILSNGASYCVDALPQEGSGTTFDDGRYAISFEIDVNGLKGPNRFGIDYFNIQVSPTGKIFDKAFQDNNDSINLNAGWNSATGAFGQIMHDGWKMNY